MPRITALMSALTVLALSAQSPQQPDWSAAEREALRHYQALVRLDTSDPPGNEQPAVDYLRGVLEREGIAVQTFASQPNRPNLVARLKGNGSRRPILIMGHTDVVNVDPSKWAHPPFGAERDGGYVYGRGTVDDKDNVTAALMVMLLLKRLNVPLDRDVVFLAEAGEEGAARLGAVLMANEHLPVIDAEYCLAEGGNVTRQGGRVKFAGIQTMEKVPRGIQLVARGVAGHGSVPLRSNAVVHLAAAVERVAAWKPEIRLNDTTRTYFERLAPVSGPEDAKRYLAAAGKDPKAAAAADEYFLDNEPRHASMLRTSISPTIIQGGYRTNVIPSEAKANLDVRMHPDDDPQRFLEDVRKVIDDPAIEVSYTSRAAKPASPGARLDSEAFKAIEAAVTKHYQAVTLPIMGTGATDMSYMRAKGMQCYGIGPAVDVEDGPKGFGGHGDQERLLEAELYRFVRFEYDVVADLARSRQQTH